MILLKNKMKKYILGGIIVVVAAAALFITTNPTTLQGYLKLQPFNSSQIDQVQPTKSPSTSSPVQILNSLSAINDNGFVRGISADNSKNTYVVGTFTGTKTFGKSPN